jgi:hypothetical protein
MRAVLLVGLIALGSCATTRPVVEPFTTPDGRAGHTAYCGGVYNQMADCHAAARETCKGNYEVISEHQSQRMVDGYSTENRDMNFICTI